MLSLNLQMVLATLGAIVLSIILFVVSYLLTPNIDTLSMPTPSISNQIVMALFWIGLSALLAFSTVGVGILINRARVKKAPDDFVSSEESDNGVNDVP